MSLIQVRNVPDDLHRRLKERAAHEGVTLSELALSELERSMERPTRKDILARIASLPPSEYNGEKPEESVRSERDAR